MIVRKILSKETNKYAKRFYQSLYDNNYKLVEGEYINSSTHVEVKCPKGHNYSITPNKFQQGRRCRKCVFKNIGKKQAKTTNQFKSEVFELVGSDYKVIGKYIKNDSHIEVKHNKCGTIYSVTPSKFLSGRRCPSCASKIRVAKRTKTQEQFEKEVFKIVGNEYSFLDDYKGAKTSIKIRHNECNNEYFVTPDKFLNGGRRCPRCNQSKGEKLIESILKENNFTYIPQDKFDGCKNERLLPFDFGVYDNDELMALVEYQGEQHYRPIDFFGGEKGFKYRKHNDNIKKSYCKNNDILLIEIKYSLTNDEVSDFLLSKLNNFSFKEVS